MIRFKKDDGSDYPDLEKIKTGDMYEFKNGLNKEKEAFGHGTPIINYMDVNKHIHLQEKDINGLVSLSNTEIENFSVKSGDLFFTRTSETIDEIGFSSVLIEDIKDCVFSGFVLRARPITDKIYPKYAGYCYRSEHIRKEIKKYSSITTRALTSGTNLKQVEINLPCLEEQKKIADFLSAVDDVIAASEQEMAALEEQKKGVMQKIFSQEVRFKADDGSDYPEWEDDELGNITSRCIVGLATSVTPYYRENGTPILRNLNIKENYLDDSDLLYLDREYASKQENKMIHTGDVITVHTGYIGISCIVPEKYNNCLTFTTLVTTVKEEVLYNKYLVQFLNSSNGMKRIMELTTTGGRNNLNTKDFIMLLVPLPCLEEQKKIADFLSDMDAAIDFAKQELEQWKELKKGLLQQLFE